MTLLKNIIDNEQNMPEFLVQFARQCTEDLSDFDCSKITDIEYIESFAEIILQKIQEILINLLSNNMTFIDLRLSMNLLLGTAKKIFNEKMTEEETEKTIKTITAELFCKTVEEPVYELIAHIIAKTMD